MRSLLMFTEVSHHQRVQPRTFFPKVVFANRVKSDACFAVLAEQLIALSARGHARRSANY